MKSGKVQNWKGSELEGLGFNLCVAPSLDIMSLISEIGGQRVRVDLVGVDISQMRMTRRFQVIEQEGLK